MMVNCASVVGSGWFGGYNVKGDAVPANGPVRDSVGVAAAISLGIGGLKAYTAASGAADGSLTERMVVKTDGKVGIGSISPAHLLALNMAAANDRAFSVYTGATSSQYGAIGFQTAFDNVQNGSEIRNYNPSGGTDADVAIWVSDSATGALAERVRIKGVNGNVGIGAIAPLAALHASNSAVQVATIISQQGTTNDVFRAINNNTMKWAVSTNGAASYNSGATNAVGATGYTNLTGANQFAIVTATAVSYTLTDRSANVIYVSPTLTATMSVPLQPGWSITAASGLVGTAIPGF